VPVSVELDREVGWIVITASGRVSIDDYRDALTALADLPDRDRRLPRVWDLYALDFGVLTPDFLKEMGEILKAFSDRASWGPVAMVVKEDFQRTIMALFAAYRQDPPPDYPFFFDLEAARQWAIAQHRDRGTVAGQA